MSTIPSRTSSTEKLRPRFGAYPYMGAAAAGVVGLAVERFGSARVLRRYQTARLRALLRHAYETVPFYRRRFDQAGFHPDQFLTLDDLQRVPITRKADLGEGVTVLINVVDDIPCEPNGKFRPYRSYLNQGAGV